MKRRLLWALLSWLSLLSFGARAQTNVPLAQETFETDGEGVRYTSNAMGAGNANIYFERRMFATPSASTTTYPNSSGPVSGQQGSYAWTGERVRGNSVGGTGTNAPNIRPPGYVQLTVPATNYKNLRLVVAFADPHCPTCSGNLTGPNDRVRLRYSFDGGPFVTAGLLVNDGGGALGSWGIDTSSPLDSVSNSTLGQAYRDVTAPISGTGTSLRVQVVVDANPAEITFDNIRVIGDYEATDKPTLSSLETATLNYTEGQAPVQVTNTLAVGYSGNNSATTITGGTVTISSGFTSGDLLNYSTQGTIGGTYSNGVLTLSGTASQAAYQAALRTITFSNSNTSTLPNGTRQITFQVSNGSAQSNTPVRNLNVTAVLTPGTLPYTENFNSDGEGTRYFGNSFARVATTTGFFRSTTSPAYFGSDKIGDQTFTGWSGGYWYGEGTNSINPATGLAVQLAPVNAAGTAGLKFVVAVGSSSTQGTGTSPAWDVNDYFKLYYRANGGSWTEFGSFTTNATLNDGVLRRGGSADSVGVGTALRYFTFPLPAAAAVASLDFQLVQLSGGDEELAFDNIRISAAVVPTVTTTAPSNITTTSATLGGNITSNGDGTLTERGVVYVVGTGTPTTSNTKALVSTSGVTTGAYSGTVSGLSPGTTYTVRAYAINEAGTGYGATITFTTTAVAPTVTTAAASSVTATSAVLGGNVTADGGAAVTGRGVVYSSSNTTPTVGGSGTTTAPNGSGTGTFSATISGLAPGTTYYVQAYATNSINTSYGGVQTFTTAAAVPTVTTTAPGSITPSSAVLGGNVTAANGATVTARGVVYSLTSANATPTIGGTGVTNAANGSGTGTFSATISSLAPGTSYSVQAYATNSAGTSYGGVQTFTTAANLATVTTAAATSITTTSAVLGGNVTADGGGAVTGRGVVYSVTSTNGTPTIGGTGVTNAANGSGTGTFSATISSLAPGTSYSVQAYATNSAGTSYGGVQTFTTNAATATVTSISRQTPTVAATATATVSYLVTFSAPVSGVTASNFNLTTTGISGASITGVSPATGSSATYSVTVNTGTGNGTLQLNVVNATGITPSVTNAPFNGTGAVYTIVKSFSAGPQLSLRAAGSASGANSDVTAFVDGVQVVQNGTSTTVANALQNGSFETNNLGANDYLYPATGLVAAPWAFTSQAGVARIGGSGFTPAASGQGSFVGFLQSTSAGNGTFTQSLTVPTGTYQVNFVAAQRGNQGTSDQVVNVFLNDGTNDVFVGTIQPGSATTYASFTSAAFAVTAPVLTATVNTTSSSPTSASPIPFSVSFSQSVGTTFIASDVTVTGGTLTSGSFSGSGAGPYSFTVTPSGAGTVTVSLAAGVANDANNTQNTASNSVSVQYQLLVTAAPVLTQPANNSITSSLPALTGTAPAGSIVTIYLAMGSNAATAIGTTTATGGSFSFTPATALAGGSYSAYATAQTSGQSVSANSNTNTFTVDTTPPTAVSSNRQNPTAATTNATSLTFRVTFSESITGVDATDFTLTTTAGTVTSSSRTVTAVSAGSYDVTVSGVSGNGTVRLDLNASGTGIADAVGNPISGGYTGGQTYTVDNTAPTATITTTATSPTSTSPIPFTVTFSEAVTGFTTSGITVTNGTISTAITNAGNAYSFSVTPTANGAVTVSVLANAAQDAAGNGNAAAGPLSVTYTTPITATVWTGTISSDWFTAGNWTAGVPTATISATIPNGTVFQPSINSGTAVTFNLTINSGATLNMNGGSLDVRANLTSNGTFLPTGGTVVLGTTLQSNGPNIFGSSRVRFWNLTINTNGVLLSTSAGASVRRLLTLNGAFVTQGNSFVLESDASGTALVVNSNSAGFVFGAATVQRYIDASGNTGTSGYRHYSSPVGNATVSSLSTSAYGGSFTAQVNAAYNTQDPNTLTLATYPNVFGYDESKIATSPAVSFSDFDKGYQSPASLGDQLTVGRGYAVQIGNTEKVQFTGPLNNNTQTINGLTYAAAGSPGAASAGWALIGNPYPAPLDWRTVGSATGSSLSGVDGAAYVFQSTSAYAGRYTSFTNNVGAGTGLIASGQGFFVRASTPGTTGSITLNNNNRVTSYANPAFQRTTAETRPLLRLSLGLGNQPATVATAQDETFLYFEAGATNGVDGKYDAYKLANPSGYYLGSVTPGSSPVGLSIDGRSPLAVATTTEIPLWVSLPAGTYSLTATELLNFTTLAGGTTVQLRDALLGTLTDLATVPSYSFSVAANAAYAGRFSLVFRTSGVLATLPGTELALAKTSLYPNPATSATALSVTDLPRAVASLQVEVVDVLGRVVGNYTLPVRSGSAHQRLATDQLASTLYLLRLTALDAQGQVQGTLPTQRLTLSH